MNILLWLYKSKVNKHGECPIWVRITINREREQFSTGLTVSTQKWRNKNQSISGSSREVIAKNDQLRQVKDKLHQIYNTLSQDGNSVSAFEVKQSFMGKNIRSPKLIETYIAHIEKTRTILRFQSYLQTNQLLRLRLKR